MLDLSSLFIPEIIKKLLKKASYSVEKNYEDTIDVLRKPGRYFVLFLLYFNCPFINLSGFDWAGLSRYIKILRRFNSLVNRFDPLHGII